MSDRYVPILVAIETDPTRYHGEHALRPGLLERGTTEQLLAHLAADLAKLLPTINQHSLAMPGALYDQTQVLQPGYPLAGAIQQLMHSSKQQAYSPGLLSIGSRQGTMPVAALQPDPDTPPGVLQLLVLVAGGEAQAMDALSDSMEHLLIDQGQVSPQSARALEALFGLAVTHARFMTITDLEAMLRLQLEHFGFLPLWELLDAAMQGTAGSFAVRGGDGQQLHWDGSQVWAQFETFDYFAVHGNGKALAAEQLEAAYSDFTRGLRRYLLTLKAHGVPLAVHLPGQVTALAGSFLVEDTSTTAPPGAAAVTEHNSEDAGTLAITVVQEGRLQHYYPLSPAGLNDVHELIRGFVPLGGIAFTRGMAVDTERRCLQAESLEP
jgi:hypothetical protein